MGLFDTVVIEEGVDLPHYPNELDNTCGWQTKSMANGMRTYKITSDGRLLRREESHREKTDEEKQAEAEKWGFDSWDAYIQAYEDSTDKLYPDSVEEYIDQTGENAPIYPTSTVFDEEWWEDHNYHGSMEFHDILRIDPVKYEKVEQPITGEMMEEPTEWALDIFISYEARFTKGDLSEIVLLGERFADTETPVQDTIDAIERWQAWKASDKDW